MSFIEPYITNLNIAESADTQVTHTSFVSLVDKYYDMVQAGYDYFDALCSDDPVENLSQFFSNLNSSLKNEDEFFALYWIEKYKTAHEAVKQRTIKILGEENVYFKDFSESMGIISDHLFTQCRSTRPHFDESYEYGDIPYPYNSTHHFLLDNNTKEIILALEKLSGTVFNQNIKHITEPHKMLSNGETELFETPAKSDEPHGVNLAVDYKHFHRMKQIAAELLAIVEEELADLTKAFRLIKNPHHSAEIRKELIEFKINGKEDPVNLSLLKNKLVSIKDGPTNKVLDATIRQ